MDDAVEKRGPMRAFACRVLGELVARSQGSPGLYAHFGRLAEEFGISLELEQDAVFLLLYNHDQSPVSIDARVAAQREQLKTLATEWAPGDPAVVVQMIAYYEGESKKSSSYLRNMPDFCQELAELVEKPEAWLDELLSQGLPGDLVGPFLRRIVRERREGWESLLDRLLDIKYLHRWAATLVLTLPDPPSALFEKVFREVPDLANLIHERCLNRSVHESTLRRLLSCPQWDRALAAAAGEWWAEPQGEVRQEVLADWRSAVLRARTEEYSDTEPNVGLQFALGCILASDAGLALEWLESRLRDPDLPRSFLGDSPFAHALRSLRKEQRLALIKEIEPVPIAADMIPLLIREDLEVYEEILALPRLADYHLSPLAGLPQKAWSDLALVALRAGYKPAQVARAAFRTHEAVVGSGIEYWEKWLLAFGEVGRKGPPELQEVSLHGTEIAQQKLGVAKGLEKHIDVHGLVGGLI